MVKCNLEQRSWYFEDQTRIIFLSAESAKSDQYSAEIKKTTISYFLDQYSFGLGWFLIGFTACGETHDIPAGLSDSLN